MDGLPYPMRGNPASEPHNGPHVASVAPHLASPVSLDSRLEHQLQAWLCSSELSVPRLVELAAIVSVEADFLECDMYSYIEIADDGQHIGGVIADKMDPAVFFNYAAQDNRTDDELCIALLTLIRLMPVAGFTLHLDAAPTYFFIRLAALLDEFSENPTPGPPTLVEMLCWALASHLFIIAAETDVSPTLQDNIFGLVFNPPNADRFVHIVLTVCEALVASTTSTFFSASPSEASLIHRISATVDNFAFVPVRTDIGLVVSRAVLNLASRALSYSNMTTPVHRAAPQLAAAVTSTMSTAAAQPLDVQLFTLEALTAIVGRDPVLDRCARDPGLYALIAGDWHPLALEHVVGLFGALLRDRGDDAAPVITTLGQGLPRFLARTAGHYLPPRRFEEVATALGINPSQPVTRHVHDQWLAMDRRRADTAFANLTYLVAIPHARHILEGRSDAAPDLQVAADLVNVMLHGATVYSPAVTAFRALIAGRALHALERAPTLSPTPAPPRLALRPADIAVLARHTFPGIAPAALVQVVVRSLAVGQPTHDTPDPIVCMQWFCALPLLALMTPGLAMARGDAGEVILPAPLANQHRVPLLHVVLSRVTWGDIPPTIVAAGVDAVAALLGVHRISGGELHSAPDQATLTQLALTGVLHSLGFMVQTRIAVAGAPGANPYTDRVDLSPIFEAARLVMAHAGPTRPHVLLEGRYLVTLARMLLLQDGRAPGRLVLARLVRQFGEIHPPRPLPTLPTQPNLMEGMVSDRRKAPTPAQPTRFRNSVDAWAGFLAAGAPTRPLPTHPTTAPTPPRPAPFTRHAHDMHLTPNSHAWYARRASSAAMSRDAILPIMALNAAPGSMPLCATWDASGTQPIVVFEDEQVFQSSVDLEVTHQQLIPPRSVDDDVPTTEAVTRGPDDTLLLSSNMAVMVWSLAKQEPVQTIYGPAQAADVGGTLVVAQSPKTQPFRDFHLTFSTEMTSDAGPDSWAGVAAASVDPVAGRVVTRYTAPAQPLGPLAGSEAGSCFVVGNVLYDLRASEPMLTLPYLGLTKSAFFYNRDACVFSAGGFCDLRFPLAVVDRYQWLDKVSFEPMAGRRWGAGLIDASTLKLVDLTTLQHATIRLDDVGYRSMVPSPTTGRMVMIGEEGGPTPISIYSIGSSPECVETWAG